MSKASEYFKISDNLFFQLMNLENPLIVSIIKDKFGNNYNTMSSLKKDKIFAYNIAEEVVKIDIEYIELLISKGLTLDEFNSDFLERFKYLYSLTDEDFLSLIEKLPNRCRVSLVYAFGIKRNKMSIENIADFLGCEEKDVLFSLKEGLSSLRRKLNTKIIKNSNIMIPISLENYLKNKGYLIKEFRGASKYYDEETLNCLKKVYGNLFSSTYTLYIPINDKEKELILKALNMIDENIKKFHENKEPEINFNKTNLLKSYEKMGFSSEQIMSTYNDLTDEEKEKIHLLYDENFNEKRVNLSYDTLIEINALTKSKTSGILFSLLKMRLSLINENMIDDIISYYENDGYERDDILLGVTRLEQGKQNLLYLKYDDNLKLKKNVIIASSAKEKIDVIIKCELPKKMKRKKIAKPKPVKVKKEKTIKEKIRNRNINSITNLYTLYTSKNYQEKEITYAISILNEEKKSFLLTYFDEKTLEVTDASYKKDPKTRNKMNQIIHGVIPLIMLRKRVDDGISIDDIIINKKIKKDVDTYQNKIEKQSGNGEKNQNRKSFKNLYDYYQNFGYEKAEISDTIKTLDQDLNLLYTYYDKDTLDLKENILTKDIYIKYLTQEKIPLMMLKRRIDDGISIDEIIKIQKVEKRINSYIKNGSKKDRKKTLSNRTVATNLYRYFERYGYNHEEIKEAFNYLNDDQKNYIFTYFDSETLEIIDSSYRKDSFNKNKMNNLFHTTIPMIMLRKRIDAGQEIDDIIITNTQNKYVDVYQNKIRKQKENAGKKQKNYNNLYDYYQSLGYETEEISDAIKALDEENKNLLFTYYDKDTLDLKESGVSKDHRVRYITQIKIPLIMLKKKIDNGQKIDDIKKNLELEKRINDYIMSKNDYISKRGFKSLYSFFEKYGYNREEIKEAFTYLSDEHKNFIFTYFDSETFLLVNTSYTKNATEKEKIYFLLHNVLPKIMIRKRIDAGISLDDLKITKKVEKEIKNYQQNQSIVRLKFTNLYRFFERYGYNHEEIKEAFNYLNDEQKNYIFTYIDEETLEITDTSYKKDSYNKMNDMLRVTLPMIMLRKRIDNGQKIDDITLTQSLDKYISTYQKKKINRMIKESENKNKKKYYKNLYDYYQSLGYEIEEISDAIKTLDEENKNLLFTYYDKDTLDLKESGVSKDHRVRYITQQTIPLIMLKKRIDNDISIDDIKMPSLLKKSIEYYIDNEKKNPRRQSSLYAALERYGFNRDEIHYTIINLETKKKEFIFTYFDSKTFDTIDNSYVKDPKIKGKLYDLIYVRIPEIMIKKRLKDGISVNDLSINNKKVAKLLNPKSLKDTSLYKYYQKYNYQRDEIDAALKTLNDDQKAFLFKYYDSKTYELIEPSISKNQKIYNQMRFLLYVTIQTIMIKRRIDNNIPISDLLLSNNLINIANKYQRKKSNNFDEYIDSLKKLNIINEELLDVLTLSDKEKFYLRLLFIWNKDNMFTIEEMSKIMKIDLNVFNKELYQSIQKLVDLLNARLEYKKTLN